MNSSAARRRLPQLLFDVAANRLGANFLSKFSIEKMRTKRQTAKNFQESFPAALRGKFLRRAERRQGEAGRQGAS